MKIITTKKLKEQYEFVCNEYIHKFTEKQDLPFDYWIGDDVGGIASFIEQYFFNLHDIIYDINTNQPKGLILQWQDDTLENHSENENVSINYYSYSKGLRYSDLKKEKE